ncbi:hypothetical protein Tco_0982637, partial [Tanacetum coccineum]
FSILGKMYRFRSYVAKEELSRNLIEEDLKAERAKAEKPDKMGNRGFKEDNASRPRFFSPLFRKLSNFDALFLESSISFNEDVLKGCFWDYVKYFEASGSFAKGYNPSFIVLIPKKSDPLRFSDYRPISLIGCIYKVISKILSIRLAKISVLINGSPTKEFSMEKGLRQGDPLSPLLFLLVAESLQVSILEACNKGLMVSLLSILFVALNWLRDKRSILVKVEFLELGFPMRMSSCVHGVLPFIYLGLPVGKKMRLCGSWDEIVNRVRSRLSAWKAKSLSIGGRLTLIKSVLGSLPIYFLSLFKALVKVINLLESMLIDPDKGGLGIGNIHAKNLGLLGKWKWRFLTEHDALLRLVIREFYGEDGGFCAPSNSSIFGGVWGDIIKASASIESIVPA